MLREIIIAGFGGQGIMVAGQLLSYAGMMEGKHVSWIPSYGPEKRGGTANCSVVISHKPVLSPLIFEPTSVIVFNRPSLEKFQSWVKPGGNIFVNNSLADGVLNRKDLRVFSIPANYIADNLGNLQVANMIMLGAYITITKVVKVNSIKEGLKTILPKSRHQLIPLNVLALKEGAKAVLDNYEVSSVGS